MKKKRCQGCGKRKKSVKKFAAIFETLKLCKFCTGLAESVIDENALAWGEVTSEE